TVSSLPQHPVADRLGSDTGIGRFAVARVCQVQPRGYQAAISDPPRALRYLANHFVVVREAVAARVAYESEHFDVSSTLDLERAQTEPRALSSNLGHLWPRNRDDVCQPDCFAWSAARFDRAADVVEVAVVVATEAADLAVDSRCEQTVSADMVALEAT